MADSSYIVIRLVPDTPVDGGTFSANYLEGLQLQVFDAATSQPPLPPLPLSDIVYSSPLSIFQWPPGASPNCESVSAPTSAPTAFVSTNDYGNTLTFDSVDGISAGACVFSEDQNSANPAIPSGQSLTVVDVKSQGDLGTVTLSAKLSNYVPAGTAVAFINQYSGDNPFNATPPSFTLPTSGPATTADSNPVTADNPLLVLHFADTTGVTIGMAVGPVGLSIAAGTTVAEVTQQTVTVSQALLDSPATVTFTLNPPFASLSLTPKSSTSTQLTFASPDGAKGVAYGMTISPQPGIAPGTTVKEVTLTTVTLSRPLLAPLPAGKAITFTFPLSTGIVQHVTLNINVSFATLGINEVATPAAVATAVIPLNLPKTFSKPLNITIKASRGGGSDVIPIDNTFYNVLWTSGDPPPPYLYQTILSNDTSLYITLPPQPGTSVIPLAIPSDGSAPPFDNLIQAIQSALANDPIQGATVSSLITVPAQCTRIAYDIIWSYQNSLPAPPDPLESLYTNPPNPGGSNNTDSSGKSSTSNLEQDRQKFEGTLNSFYSTRNANAERLTKFVAAASAAVYCEQTSLNSTTALLEFPVDPSSSFARAVESELLVKGLGVTGTSGLNFGVPAAFFYALGAHLDKTTTATQRFQLASGEAVERLFQQFSTAENAGVIRDSEPFTNTSLGLPKTTSFQAARRLVALGVSAASTSSSVTVIAGSPLASLISDWLSAVDPATTSPVNPPLTYQNADFNIWTQQLSSKDPQGYLDLDLDALIQGYIIPGSSATLAEKIAALLSTLPISPQPPTVETLKAVTAAQWTTFFTSNPSWLPPFTQPVAPGASPSTTTQQNAGYIATRIRAFIRAVQQFFTVSSVATTAQLPAPGAPPTFDLPSYDPINLAVKDPSLSGFTFGSTLSSTDLVAAAQDVFSSDLSAQAWLIQAMTTINELYEIASVVPNPPTPGYTLPNPVSLRFSVMEALYARGFRNAKDITNLSAEEFQQALTGTVAYDFANTTTNSLYQKAKRIAPRTSSSNQTDGSFQPINPDGSLVNCIPPPCLSPTSPIAYLNELLQLTPGGTCDEPLVKAPPSRSESEQQTIRVYAQRLWEEAGKPEDRGDEFWLRAESTLQAKGIISVFPPPTLGSVLAKRRGPLGNLAASCANLETPLPLIDIANECLEYLAATQPPPSGSSPSGTIYDTSASEEELTCHEPATIFAAIPEYSTPATPALFEAPPYKNLKIDFSACNLPYSQALDVSRTYLRYFGTSRFEETRTFRKCITEFVLDPVNEPVGFQDHLWRYPVRIDTAIEYLGITPEEYKLLFQGTWPRPCGTPVETPIAPAPGELPVWQLYGFLSANGDNPWTNIAVKLPEFLSRTCLSYCEFVELWKSGFVQFRNGGGQEIRIFPDCEPCCLDRLWLKFPGETGAEQPLYELVVFIRLWRKLKEFCGEGYSFDQLRDICDVLHLFKGNAINPDFIRQLAAFQMLRDHFGLSLVDPKDKPAAGAIDADRTHLLALWVGKTAAKWPWAVKQMIEQIEHYAKRHHNCDRRSPEFIKLLVSNLDPLSHLAGFDPTTNTHTWHALPTHTLRFAEV